MPPRTVQYQTVRFDQESPDTQPPFPDLDSEQTLVLAFGAPSLIDSSPLFKQIQEHYPTSHIVGCSTAGEIHGSELHDNSLSLAVIQFNHTELASHCVEIEDAGDSYQAGTELAAQFAVKDGLSAIFVVSDGICVNGSALVRGLSDTLPSNVTITGGLAADGADFNRTWVLKNGEPTSGIVTAVGFYGDKVQISHGSKGGWDVFGPQRTVTRSKDNVLYELDGQPALPLYTKYLGDLAADLPGSALLFPLALMRDKDDTDPVVRTILGVNEEDGSLTFAGDIPEGSIALLMHANFDRLIGGAGESADLATATIDSDDPCLCIAISCVGRRLVLGARTEEELERIADSLPPESGIVGFYSYGEISPLASGECSLHNQTMTLTTIREAA